MNQLKRFAKEHTMFVAVVSCALLAFVAFSVMQCTATNMARQAEEQATQEEQQVEEELSADGSQLIVPKVELTEEEQRIVDRYTLEEQEAIGLLVANVWTTTQEASSLVFSETAFTETRNETSTTHKFIINDLIKATDQQGLSASYMMAATIDGSDVFVVQINQVHDERDGFSVTYVTSAAFNSMNGYVASSTSGSANLQVAGLDTEAWVNTFGDSAAAFTEQMRLYCAANYPSATVADWSRQVTTDYEAGVVDTTFKLNNTAGTTLHVTYNVNDGSFEISFV